MSRPYTSVLDQPDIALPLTDSYATYMRGRLTNYEDEIAKFDKNEASLLADLAACRAVREELAAIRDRYLRKLGANHATPENPQQHWQVDPKVSTRQVEEPCPPCGELMLWTEAYGYVHEVDGWWVVAGQWCAQSLPKDATTVIPAIEGEPAS